MENDKWTVGRIASVAATTLIVIFTIIAGIAAAGIWLLPNFDPFGVKKGHFGQPGDSRNEESLPVFTLVANRDLTPEFIPYGNGLPTVVSFPNNGVNECLIQGVDFRPLKRFATPKRDDLTAAAKALPVNFKHYDRKSKSFKIRFNTPHPVPGTEWATLKIAIVNAKWGRVTYLGEVTVIYNGGRRHKLEGLAEVDVLPREPKHEVGE